MKTILVAINSKYVHTALGLRYVNEACKKQSIDTKLIEETIQTPILAVLAEITKEEPNTVGFSVHIWNKDYVYSLIELLKKVRPNVKIIVGGPEVAFDPERIFSERSEIDFIVQGEGEECLPNLLELLSNNIIDIPKHISFRDANGKIHENSGITIIEDLDNLEYPYPDLDKVVADNKIVYYECTRGCPFRCTYCLSGISRFVRRRSLKKVLQDLERFIQAGVKLVKFVDRTYNLDEDYFLPIMQYLAAADTETTFHFEIKADLLSERTLSFLETVPPGRFQFEIGVQSTNTATLEAIGRENNWEKLAVNVKKLLKNENIHLHLDLIAGLPHEGLKEFIKSFNDVYALHPHMLQLGFLKVLQGTEMQKQAAEHEILYMSDAPYEVIQTKYLRYEQLRFLKVLEDVFENTHNTGKFNNILSYLIRISGGEAFDFYCRLTDWWESRNLYPQRHNVRSVTKLLWEFICDCYPQEQKIAKEIIRFDVFVSQPNWTPGWLGWKSNEINGGTMAFWRDVEEVKRYLPEYIFSTWREIHKNYPIEAFDYDVMSDEPQRVYFMANYSDDKSIVKFIQSDYLKNN